MSRSKKRNPPQRVEKLVYSGDGLLRIEEGQNEGRKRVLFIPGVLEGELVEYTIVEQKKNYGRALPIKIVEASPDRIVPHCSHFYECGGCQMQHIAFHKQGEIQQKWLQEMIDPLTKGRDSCRVVWRDFGNIPWQWRRKITLHLFFLDGICTLGYYKKPHCSSNSPSSSKLFPVQECPIFFSVEEEKIVLDQARKSVQSLFKEPFARDIKGNLSFIRLDHFLEKETSSPLQLSVHLSIQGKKPSQYDSEQFFSEVSREFGALKWAAEISADFFGKRRQIKGSGTSLLKIGSRSISIPHHIFSQNHPIATSQMQRDIAKHLHKKIQDIVKKSVIQFALIDLYAGFGPVSLLVEELLSEEERERCAGLYVVEQSHPACAIFKQIADTEFSSIPSFVYPISVEESFTLLYSSLNRGSSTTEIESIWNVNPPREGLSIEVRKKLMSGLFGSFGIYTSCHPTTLQRDLFDFIANGWQVEEAFGYDLFPMTTHFETVVILKKRESKERRV